MNTTTATAPSTIDRSDRFFTGRPDGTPYTCGDRYTDRSFAGWAIDRGLPGNPAFGAGCSAEVYWLGAACAAHNAAFNGTGPIPEVEAIVRDQPKTDGLRRTPVAVVEPMDPRADEAMAWLVANAAKNEFALSVLTGWNKFGRPTPRQMEAVLRNVDRDATRAAAAPVAPAAPKADAAEGWYRFEGNIYKVQIAVHGSGKPYAKRLVVAGFGEATWEYEQGMVRRLTPAMALTVEEAAEFGTLYGVCAVCGRTLTDEVSIARGIGPVCIGRLA